MSAAASAMPARPPPAKRIASARTAADVALRVVLAVPGGYALTYALTAAAAVGLVRCAAISRVDAALLSTNLALLVYPGLGIWAFATRRPLALAAAAASVSAALWAAAWALRL